MTIAQFCKGVRVANPGLTVRWLADTREYRVAWPRDEVSAYYTNDQDDAAGTARAMWRERYIDRTYRTRNSTSHGVDTACPRCGQDRPQGRVCNCVEPR